jgi:hypothetical protein
MIKNFYNSASMLRKRFMTILLGIADQFWGLSRTNGKRTFFVPYEIREGRLYVQGTVLGKRVLLPALFTGTWQQGDTLEFVARQTQKNK